MVQEQPQQQSEHEKRLDELGAHARRSTSNHFQNLLATELATATFSADPLQKIRHVLEGYKLLEQKERDKVSTLEEAKMFQRMYDDCLAFLGIEGLPSDDMDRRAFIPFTFEDVALYFGDFAPQYATEENLGNFKSGAVTLSSCTFLKNLFLSWAMDKVIILNRKMMKTFIDKKVWFDTLSIVRASK